MTIDVLDNTPKYAKCCNSEGKKKVVLNVQIEYAGQPLIFFDIALLLILSL